MECVILAGGLGTRMRPLTSALPKALLAVAGRPFIDHQLQWLASQGVRRVVLSIGYRGELVRDHVGTGDGFGISVDFVDEGAELRGTGGALRLALDEGALPEAFLVLYGDSYLPVPLPPVWTAFHASRAPALMTVLRNEGRWDKSNACYADGRVLLYDKAKSEGMDYIDYGLSVMARDVIAKEVPPGGRHDLADVFHRLSRSGQLAGYEVHTRFYEIGSPSGLVELERFLTSKAIRPPSDTPRTY